MFYAKQFSTLAKIFMFFFVPLTTIVTMILADNIKMVKKLQKIFYSSLYMHKGLFSMWYNTLCVSHENGKP